MGVCRVEGGCERRCCRDERHKVTPGSSEELQRSVSSNITGSELLRLNSKYREKREKVGLGDVVEYNHRNEEPENAAVGPIGRHALPWRGVTLIAALWLGNQRTGVTPRLTCSKLAPGCVLWTRYRCRC